MSRPIVTALVDTYNHEEFIEQALNSVLSQDFPPGEMEILVVDDGSTDRTPDIVRRFEPRVRLIRKTNGGQASAFNTGIPEARGEIIAFLDGDDWWVPRKIITVTEAFRENPDIDMVGHGFVQTSGREQQTISAPILKPMSIESIATAKIFRLYRCYFGTSRLALRATVARSVLPVPPALIFEADEYIFTLAAKLSRFVILPDALTFYRVHRGNLFLAAGSSRGGLRKKQQVLAGLAAGLRKGLAAHCTPTEIADCLLEIVEAEELQLRLMLDGGPPWRTVQTEHTLYRIQHARASVQQKVFHHLAFLPAYVLPPQWFYRARVWITAQPWYARARRAVAPVPQISTLDGSSHVHE